MFDVFLMPLLLSFGSRSIVIRGYATIPRAKRHQIKAEFWSQVMSDRDLSPGQDRVSVAYLLSSAHLQTGDLTRDLVSVKNVLIVFAYILNL